jgi:hypothetical protein
VVDQARPGSIMHNWRDLVWKRLADAGIDRIAIQT